MAILTCHLRFYREMFGMNGVLSDPILTLGFQDILGGRDQPKDFQFSNLKELLVARGKNVITLDLFDTRADLRYDLNLPVPECEHNKYGLVLDVGTIEHVFDTKTCIESCLRMVRVGGCYLLHTVVNGYYRHGLHVFNPEGLIDALRANNCDIMYIQYSTAHGEPIDSPEKGDNVLVWIVAKKLKAMETFSIPQQRLWDGIYNHSHATGDLHKTGNATTVKQTSLIKQAARTVLKPTRAVLAFLNARLR